jgi:hypothetical protein
MKRFLIDVANAVSSTIFNVWVLLTVLFIAHWSFL